MKSKLRIAWEWLMQTKLVRFLFRDKVDLIMLILSIMFVVLYFIKTPEVSSDNFSDGNFSAWIAILCLYILGSIWRMGSLVDSLKQYVTNPEYRRHLGLDLKISSKYDKKMTVIFFTFVVIMLILVFFSLYNI